MAGKGGKREGAGRPKGTPNKTTKQIRDAFQCFVEDNTDKMQEWLERVAEKNPAKALELLGGLSEYILPKLSRAEIEAKVEVTDEVDLSQYKTEDLKKAIENDSDKDKS